MKISDLIRKKAQGGTKEMQHINKRNMYMNEGGENGPGNWSWDDDHATIGVCDDSDDD